MCSENKGHSVTDNDRCSTSLVSSISPTGRTSGHNNTDEDELVSNDKEDEESDGEAYRDMEKQLREKARTDVDQIQRRLAEDLAKIRNTRRQQKEAKKKEMGRRHQPFIIKPPIDTPHPTPDDPSSSADPARALSVADSEPPPTNLNYEHRYWNVVTCMLAPIDAEPVQPVSFKLTRKPRDKKSGGAEQDYDHTEEMPNQGGNDTGSSGHEQIIKQEEESDVPIASLPSTSYMSASLPATSSTTTTPRRRKDKFYSHQEQLRRVFQDEDAVKKFWKAMKQAAPSAKTEVLTSRPPGLVRLIRSRGRWPEDTATKEERLACWRREADCQWVTTYVFPNVGDAVDIAQIFNPKIAGNDVAKEWFVQILSVLMERKFEQSKIEASYKEKILKSVNDQPKSPKIQEDKREAAGEALRELTYDITDIPKKLADWWTKVVGSWSKDFPNSIPSSTQKLGVDSVPVSKNIFGYKMRVRTGAFDPAMAASLSNSLAWLDSGFFDRSSDVDDSDESELGFAE